MIQYVSSKTVECHCGYMCNRLPDSNWFVDYSSASLANIGWDVGIFEEFTAMHVRFIYKRKQIVHYRQKKNEVHHLTWKWGNGFMQVFFVLERIANWSASKRIQFVYCWEIEPKQRIELLNTR